MGRLGRFVALAVLTAALPTVAVAQVDRRSYAACHGPGSEDAKLQGCERLIASGRVRGAEIARAYNQRGVIFNHRKQFNAAIAELNAAIEHNPKDGVYFFNRGYAYFHRGDYDRTIADTTEAIRLNYRTGATYQWRGLAHSWKKDHDRAIADFSQAIAVDPKLADAYWNRGTSLVHKDELDRAVKDMTEAIRLRPDTAGPYYRDRGIAFERKGELDKALADLRRALTLIPQDQAATAAATRVEQTVATKACSSSGAGTEEEKLQRCERIITSGTVKGRALARVYNERGVVYIIRKQFDAAIAELTEALRHETTDPVMYYNRSFALLSRRDYDRAIADAAQALALYANAPNDRIYNIRGLAYIWKGEHDRAIADFTEAIKLKSDDANLFSNRGFALFRKGEHDRAIADFNEVIRLNPAISSPARSRLGTILSLRGEHDRALAELNEAVRLTPRRALPYWYRGFAFERAGEMEKALADFRKVLSIDINTEDMGQAVARIELRAAEEAAQAIARIEQQIAAKAAAGAAPPAASAAPRDTVASTQPARITPEDAARLIHDVLMTSCTLVPLGERVVRGPELPKNLQAMQDAGIAKVATVRKNDDGTTVYSVTLADGIDRNELRVNERTCVPQFRNLGVTAVKNFNQIKGGTTGWDALMFEAEYAVQRSNLAEKLRKALASEDTAGPQKGRLLLRYDATAKAWWPVAFDTAAADGNYQTSNVWTTLAND